MISVLGPGSRLQWLQCVLDGLNKTGIPLICQRGGGLIAGPGDDDAGMYYFVPKLAHWTGLSINAASNLSTLVFFFLSALIGLIGFFVLFRNWVSRFIALVVIGSLYWLLAVKSEDGIVYLSGSFLVVMIVPWLLYFMKIKKPSIWIGLSLLVFGILMGLSGYIRVFSSVPLIVFAFTMIIFATSLSVKQKMMYALVICIGLGYAYYFFNSLIQQRDDFLLAKNPHYEKIVPYHPTWHNIYMGFGYLPNPEGIIWRDDFSFKKAHSIDPHVKIYSDRYEEILKNQTLQFVKKYPLLTVKILYAKAFKLISYAIVFIGAIIIINILQWTWLKKKNLIEQCRWSIEIPLLLLLLLNALPPIATYPKMLYSFTFIAAAGVYMLVKTDQLINAILVMVRNKKILSRGSSL